MRGNPLQAVDDLQVIKDEVIRLDSAMAGEEHTQGFRAAVLVLSAACFGPDVDDLVAFTRYPRDFVASVSQRMRSCGLWGDGFVNDDWWIQGAFGDEISRPGFWTDVLVAQGMVTVVGRDDKGRLLFGAIGNGPG